MKKVIFFIPIEHGKIGGAERRELRVFKELLKYENNDLQFYAIITNRDNIESINIDLSKEINENKILFLYNIKPSENKFLKKIKKIIYLFSLKKEKFLSIKDHEKIILYFTIDPSIWSYLLPKILKIEDYISFVADSRFEYIYCRKNLLEKYYVYKSLKKAKFIITLSEKIKDQVLSCIPSLKNKEITIYPGSFTSFENINFDFSGKKDNYLYDLVLIGRWDVGKGHELLFDALKIIISWNKHNLIGKIGIFGFGPLENYIKKEVEELRKYYKIDAHEIKDPFKVLSKAKFSLSLQKFNNYPSQVVIESLASGVKVIATNVGETEKFKLRELNIGYTTDYDKFSLAETMIKCIEQDYYYLDINEKIRIHEIAKKEFSIDKVIKFMIEIFNKI